MHPSRLEGLQEIIDEVVKSFVSELRFPYGTKIRVIKSSKCPKDSLYILEPKIGDIFILGEIIQEVLKRVSDLKGSKDERH